MRTCRSGWQTSSRPTCAACWSGSTRASARPKPATTSRTRATTSGGCWPIPASPPQLLAPDHEDELLANGLGITNAARRVTRGSGELRRTDFADAGERLSRIARELRPGAFAFVGKQAYAGAFGERVDHGLQARQLEGRPLFVLPSTSPANAAVLYPDKLHWFVALRELLEGLPVSPPAASGR